MARWVGQVVAVVTRVRLETEQVPFRAHLTNRLRHGDEPLHRWIVRVAHQERMQGATILEYVAGDEPDA